VRSKCFRPELKGGGWWQHGRYSDTRMDSQSRGKGDQRATRPVR
jgi:hypothetical protein